MRPFTASIHSARHPVPTLIALLPALLLRESDDVELTIKKKKRMGGGKYDRKKQARWSARGCERRGLMNLSADHLISWLMVKPAKLPGDPISDKSI